MARPLEGSGTAGLAWWKMRRFPLRDSAPGERFRQSYLAQSLQTALRESEVGHLFSLLRAAGVEPILLKGLAAAASYAEPGLRPQGDIDLCLKPGEYETAKEVIWGPGREGRALVDLNHDARALLDRGGWEGVYDRSLLVGLNGSEVRVLGHEDNLRYLCLHLLRHSAYRPLWLCDVAAALEAAPAEVDWELALGKEKLTRNWVTCVIDLARRLLGARREDVPEEVASARAPTWLVAQVLRQWERPTTAEHLPRELMAVSLRHPARALPALLGRWPDPIRAVVGLKQPFDERARLPKQLRFYVSQAAAFLRRPLRRSN